MGRGLQISHLAVVALVALLPVAHAQDPDPIPSVAPQQPTTVRATQCVAETQAKKAKDGAEAAMALYIAAGAACGIACAGEPTQASGTACTGLSFGAMGYDVYQALTYSKDLSSLMGLIMGVQGLTASTGTTIGLWKAGGTAGAEGGAAAGTSPTGGALDQSGDFSGVLGADEAPKKPAAKEEKDTGYCNTMFMNLLQAAMKAVTVKQSKNAADNAKEECENQAGPTTNLTLGAAPASLDANASNPITELGAPPGLRGAGAQSSDSSCTRKARDSLSTFQTCATAADPSLSKFFNPNAQQDFKDTLGIGMDKFIGAGSDSPGLGGKLSAGLAAAGKGGPDTEEASRALEKILMDAAEKSSGSTYAGGGGGSGRRASAKDALDPKKLIKDMMAALTGNKEEDAKTPRSKSTVFAAARGPAADLSLRRDISLFDRVDFRYRANEGQFTPGGYAP